MENKSVINQGPASHAVKNEQLQGKNTPLHKDESNIEYMKKQGVPGYGGEADSNRPGGPNKDTSGEKVNDPNDIPPSKKPVVAEKKRQALEEGEEDLSTDHEKFTSDRSDISKTRKY